MSAAHPAACQCDHCATMRIITGHDGPWDEAGRQIMKRYVITFGVASGLGDGWVEATAPNEIAARLWARRTYGECWAGIYDADEFLMRGRTVDLYPRGCFGEVEVPE